MKKISKELEQKIIGEKTELHEQLIDLNKLNLTIYNMVELFQGFNLDTKEGLFDFDYGISTYTIVQNKRGKYVIIEHSDIWDENGGYVGVFNYNLTHKLVKSWKDFKAIVNGLQWNIFKNENDIQFEKDIYLDTWKSAKYSFQINVNTQNQFGEVLNEIQEEIKKQYVSFDVDDFTLDELIYRKENSLPINIKETLEKYKNIEYMLLQLYKIVDDIETIEEI